LVNKFPYDRPRIGQIELSKFLYTNLREDVVAIVSAPTGFGKTISILYASRALVDEGRFDKVFYVVRTRNELDPVIRDGRKVGMRFSILYSIARMCPLARGKNISSDGFWAVCSLLRIKGLCEYYRRTRSLDIPQIFSSISSSRDHTDFADRLSKEIGVCPYFTSLELLDYVDLYVATYPYIFKESIKSWIFSDRDFSQTLLVIDEAHNILNIGSLMGESISIDVLDRAIRELEELSLDTDTLDFLKNLTSIKVDDVGKGYTFIGRDRVGLDKGVADRLMEIAIEASLEMFREHNDIDNVEDLDLSIYRVAKFVKSAVNNHFEIFVSRERPKGLTIHTLPIDFDVVREIIEQFPSAILMSGTSPDKSFIEKGVGIKKHIEVVDVEEYGARNYLRENAVAIMFTGATTSYRERTERMFKTYSKLIETLYRVHRGGVIMVIYPSYEVMNSIVSLISSDIEMVIESLKPLSQIIDEIARKEKVVVNTVAGGRLAEGIELTVNGESLIKTVVVVGVPYPQPDDYIEFIKRDLQKKGYIYTEYYRDLAIMRVLQAVGRAIRSEKDYALIVLADRRYRQKKLLEKIKLNIKAVTDSINTIEKIVSSLNQ